jgi:hypothetical protein
VAPAPNPPSPDPQPMAASGAPAIAEPVVPGGSTVSDGEWVSTLDRIDELGDAAADEVLNRLAAAGFLFGPALTRDVFLEMNQWMRDAGALVPREFVGNDTGRLTAESTAAAGAAAGPVSAHLAGGVETPRRVAGWRPGAAKTVLPGPAVLGPDRLLLPGWTVVAVTSPAAIDEVGSIAVAHGARTIIVHPSTPDPTGFAVPPAQCCQQTIRADGHAVTVVILAHDTFSYCGPWADAATADELFERLERFRRVVGHPWRSSVGRTGEALMRFCHPPKRAGSNSAPHRPCRSRQMTAPSNRHSDGTDRSPRRSKPLCTVT